MGDASNEVHGDVSGAVVQAHTIHHVHLHYPPDTSAGESPGASPTAPPLSPVDRPTAIGRTTAVDWPAEPVRPRLPRESPPYRDPDRWKAIGGFALVMVIVLSVGTLVVINIHPSKPDPVATGRVFHPRRTAQPAGSTLLFSDDFRRSPGSWAGIGGQPDGSSARINTGDAQLVLTAAPGGTVDVAPRPDPAWASTTDSQVDLGFPDDQEVPPGGSFTAFCRVDQQGDGYGLTLIYDGTELTKYVSGKWTTLAYQSGSLNNSGTNLHLACTNENGGVRIRAWTDNMPVADYTDRADPITRGSPIALLLDLATGYGDQNYPAQVDDVAVYRLP